MKIGPKYKIARRLGAPVFEKTQSQKYALSEERKTRGRRPRSRTEYGLQLTEKQKARYFYGITESQFKNYVKKILDKKTTKSGKESVRVSPASSLISSLESRLDNTVWRAGIAPTHLAARQLVAHGHITVNGRRAYTPSQELKVGDKLGIREGSKKSPIFQKWISGEKSEKVAMPTWLSVDDVKKEVTVKSKPTGGEAELMFDIGKVIQFYQR